MRDLKDDYRYGLQWATDRGIRLKTISFYNVAPKNGVVLAYASMVHLPAIAQLNPMTRDDISFSNVDNFEDTHYNKWDLRGVFWVVFDHHYPAAKMNDILSNIFTNWINSEDTVKQFISKPRSYLTLKY